MNGHHRFVHRRQRAVAWPPRSYGLSAQLRDALSGSFMVNLGKKIINIGNGIINLGENFIESLCMSYWETLDGFRETANKAGTNSRRDLPKG
jgi:hypothetical protein